MPVEQLLPDDHPMIIAWKAYSETGDYDNTRNWAKHDKHVDGSLWAAFAKGYEASAPTLAAENAALKADVIELRELVDVLNVKDAAHTNARHAMHKELGAAVARSAVADASFAALKALVADMVEAMEKIQTVNRRSITGEESRNAWRSVAIAITNAKKAVS